MADALVPSQNGLKKKFKDRGDGSYAEIVEAGSADGSNVTLGAVADAAVQNASGTINAHLRGAVVDLLAIIAQIGEVQASPTANTALDRLKTLATLLGGGLPASLGQKARAASLAATLSTEDVTLLGGGLPSALTAGGGLKAGLVDALPAGEAHVGAVGGALAVVSAELTRPADTAAYIAGDVVSDSTVASTLLTFTSAARVTGGSGYITKVRLVTDQSTNVAQLRLWLYTINNPTVAADNAPMTLLYANRSNRIGYVDIPACATEMSGSDSASAMDATIRLAFKCGADANLYGLLETKTAFTPTSGQKFFVELTVDQN